MRTRLPGGTSIAVATVCSDECRRRYVNDLRRIERRAKLDALPPVNCVECGAKLRVTRSDVRYCSTRCRVHAHRDRQRVPP
jgi:predicted nucleic acid-binding Zn ribbon protein